MRSRRDTSRVCRGECAASPAGRVNSMTGPACSPSAAGTLRDGRYDARDREQIDHAEVVTRTVGRRTPAWHLIHVRTGGIAKNTLQNTLCSLALTVMAALTRKRVDNLATLRALTHPLRTRLLSALRADGPATGSELGRRFGESSGATSYHLRQLARYGFVVEDDDQPSRREKRWRAAHELSSWAVADFIDDPASQSALRVLDHERIRWMVDRLREWYAERPSWSPEWVSAAEDSDIILRLRADELAELSRELWEVIARRAEHQQPTDDVDAKRVAVYLYAFPTYDVVG